MKRILSLRRNSYIARVGILLIAIALIVGTVSCRPTTRYNLIMAVSPAGSGNAADLTGGSPYTSGTVVNIQATPLDSYQFVKWTAPAGTFANLNLATTTFTMPAQNVTATAHFVGPLDHFKCYGVNNATSLGKDVTLKDQFITINATVRQASLFANPAAKDLGLPMPTPIWNPDHHLTFYEISCAEMPRTWYVEVYNQFGNQNLTVSGPVALAVPTQKLVPGNHTEPVSLDHYLLYEVIDGPLVDVGVALRDEFGNDIAVQVGQPVLFANPVQKTVGTAVTNITHPNEHLVFYAISGCTASSPQVQVANQFGNQTLNLGQPAVLLGAPSEKIAWGEQIDHFKCYPSWEAEPINKVVQLKDQFVTINATVEQAVEFCNPVAKKQYGMEVSPILNPDYHLTIYTIDCTGGLGEWLVQVQNQFGTQDLRVLGPVALAVPTWKQYPGDHQSPVGLDHYLLYEVIDSTPVGVVVDLIDEFSPEPDYVTALTPYLFANPVQKTVEGEEVAEIENSMAHLVFYVIDGSEVLPPSYVQVVNQFVATSYDLSDPANMLAVPSLKLDYALYYP
jgi:hypothetical protein